MDQILAEEEVDGGTADLVQWTLTDHLNTVWDIAKYDPGSDMTTVVNHLIYDAFGWVRAESNPAVDSLFLFTARPFDPDTGLQNNLNRWYDPSVGRWISEDPIGFNGGDGNLYRYVGNNVPCAVDPGGLENFYVCGQPVQRQDCQGEIARTCGLTHVAIYGDKSGEIYDGWFGPKHPLTGTGLPHGKGVWCKRLHRVTEIVIPVPSTVPVPPIVHDLKMKWGPPGVRGKSCRTATEAEIRACLLAKPGRNS
ncbi:hypothetical protein JCM19992_24780 [Thermostilla marina]